MHRHNGKEIVYFSYYVKLILYKCPQIVFSGLKNVKQVDNDKIIKPDIRTAQFWANISALCSL